MFRNFKVAHEKDTKLVLVKTGKEKFIFRVPRLHGTSLVECFVGNMMYGIESPLDFVVSAQSNEKGARGCKLVLVKMGIAQKNTTP